MNATCSCVPTISFFSFNFYNDVHVLNSPNTAYIFGTWALICLGDSDLKNGALLRPGGQESR
jgi:hypothetical protein